MIFGSRVLRSEPVEGIVSAVTGVLANVRQNAAFTLESPLVELQRGRRPGTGEITISLAIELTHEITATGTEASLRADRPRQGLISRFVVRSLSFDSGLQLNFPTPFPHFSQRFPGQRGERSAKSGEPAAPPSQ
jgi:hypothetical protein